MANDSEAALAGRLASAPYAAKMKQLYGDALFGDPHRTLAAAGAALEAYQQTRAQFAAYTSKYDAFLRGQAQLSVQELRGLAAFNDPAKGNCAHCHKSQPSLCGIFPLFTDFGYVPLGVPRNPQIPANADPAYFDLGACGPLRKDLANRPEFCGLFRAPSLRNVATRHSFYHNGVFHSLKDAVAFYATRDTDPQRWYPQGRDKKLRKFNELPARYQGNIDYEPPFGRHPGDTPALSEQDVTDIVAFLGTLTDGFKPQEGARKP